MMTEAEFKNWWYDNLSPEVKYDMKGIFALDIHAEVSYLCNIAWLRYRVSAPADLVNWKNKQVILKDSAAAAAETRTGSIELHRVNLQTISIKECTF